MPPAGPTRRRRGRTALIVTGAAVLGILAGTCAGYLIQADREPTELPPLSQPVLTQARGEGPESLPAAQDRRVRTDGDLRELLLKKPHGAREAEWADDDGWLDLAEYADFYDSPRGAFGDLVQDEFRRATDTGWTVGERTVEIRLAQYHQEESLAAREVAESACYWAEEEDGTDSRPIPGTGDGMAYVHTRPETEPGYKPVYSAEAHAWRGDIAVHVWVSDTKPLSQSTIMDLAKRQMERL
ncbi:hypothetical protein [Streptomyces poonensis]|uniref:hypothetical protein n=1 Tax=Streptomyces poonensis TaxID=68255 RepID=UPI0027E4C259|nr:hypothetical protein [Streptomyces poonensis]